MARPDLEPPRLGKPIRSLAPALPPPAVGDDARPHARCGGAGRTEEEGALGGSVFDNDITILPFGAFLLGGERWYCQVLDSCQPSDRPVSTAHIWYRPPLLDNKKAQIKC